MSCFLHQVGSVVLYLKSEVLPELYETIHCKSGSCRFKFLNAVSPSIDTVAVQSCIAGGCDVGRRVADADGSCVLALHFSST